MFKKTKELLQSILMSLSSLGEETKKSNQELLKEVKKLNETVEKVRSDTNVIKKKVEFQ